MAIGRLGCQGGRQASRKGTRAGRTGALLGLSSPFRSGSRNKVVVNWYLTTLCLVEIILRSLFDALTDRMPGRCGVELHFCGNGADKTRGGATTRKEAGACRVIGVTNGACLKFERLGFGGAAERDDSRIVGLEFDKGRFGEAL